MKRLIVITAIAVLSLCLLYSCAEAEASEDVKLWPKQVSEDGLWGYVDAAGNWMIPPQYDDANVFHGNYACVTVIPASEKEQEYPDTMNREGLIDRTGAFVLEPNYEIVQDDSGELDWNGYYVVTRMYEYGIFAETFFDIPSGHFSGQWFDEVLCSAGKGDLIPVVQYSDDDIRYMGYADRTTGELVFPCEYYLMEGFSFQEDVGILARIAGFDEEGDPVPGEYQLVTREGEVIHLPDGIVPGGHVEMSDGLISVKDTNTGLYGFADRNGNVVIQPVFACTYEFINGQATVELTDGHCALIDREGNILLRDDEEDFPIVLAEDAGTAGKPRFAFCGENGLYGYIDAQGHIVIPPQFEHADDFRGNYAEVRVHSSVWPYDTLDGLMDANGRWIFRPDRNTRVISGDYYEPVYGEKDSGIFVISGTGSDGKEGFLDIVTGFFSGLIYDKVHPRGDISVLVPVVMGGKLGFADRQTGEIRIPCRYQIERDDRYAKIKHGFQNGYAVLRYPDEPWLLIDENGEETKLPVRVIVGQDEMLFDKDGNILSSETYPSNRYYFSDHSRYYIKSESQEDTLELHRTEDDMLIASVTIPNLVTLYSSGSDKVLWYEIRDPDEQESFPYKYGLVNNRGEVLTEPVFQRDYQRFADDMCIVQQIGSRLFGYLDENGNLVIPPKYKYAQDFENGIAWVVEERPSAIGGYSNMIEERKLINKAGEVLFTETQPDLWDDESDKWWD